MTQTEIPPEKKLPELVVYYLVDRSFEIDNTYVMGGIRPNAKHIASQYGCHLEFRNSQFRETGLMNFLPSYLEIYDIGRDGSCISAVLVGEDWGKLTKARDDIQRRFGVIEFDGGAVDVGHDKAFLSK